MVKELTMSMHLAQVLEPLHVIVSIISQIRARLHAYSHEPDSNQSKRILELIIIERKLEVVLNQLIEEYGKDIIRIFYISTGRMTLSLSTSLIFLIPERYGDFFFLIPVFLFLIIANMYRVWSVADAAQFVRYQILWEKCTSESGPGSDMSSEGIQGICEEERTPADRLVQADEEDLRRSSLEEKSSIGEERMETDGTGSLPSLIAKEQEQKSRTQNLN
ncbi:unnamed protein product [Nezara viridula]|uniref:Uncharacterized protein n=1 Tax=Nezara viridula TaxID=85310 RepID=A0A9P0GZU9_NEZVI|nr:unnamed protein product [Nezara viridula]